MKYLHRTAILLSIFLMLIAISVLYGWVINSAKLIQIRESFAPMQFNTAICFILSAIASLTLFLQYRNTSIIATILCLIISTVTLSQYFFGINFKIDELFIKHNITTESLYPGRMSPNTAICFIFNGLSVLLCHQKLKDKYIFSEFFNYITLLLSCFAVIGYLSIRYISYGWDNVSHMAIHTCAGFLCLFYINFTYIKTKEKTLENVGKIEYTIFFSVSILFILIWAVLINKERVSLQNLTGATVTTMKDDFSYKLKKQALAIYRISDRWSSSRDGTSEASWRKDVANYINNYKIFNNFSVVSSDANIIMIEPKNEMIEYKTLKSILEDTNLNKNYTVSNIHQVKNKFVFYVISPILNNKKNTYDKFVVAAYDLKETIEGLIADSVQSNYFINVLSNNIKIWDNNKIIEPDNKLVFKSAMLVSIDGLKLSMHVMPKPDILNIYITSYPTFILLMGFVLTLALTYCFMLISQEHKLKLKAEEATAAKSYFLSNMSHEIRTPLNAIIGYAEISSKMLENNDKSEIKLISEKINAIKRSGEYLLSLINDILDFSKIEANKIELENTEIEINKFIEDLNIIVENGIKGKNINYNLELNDNVPPSLCGDLTKFKQVVFNLVNNAVKFTGEGNINVDIEYIKSKNILQVKVSDTGIGIPKDKVELIFEAFSQVDSTTSRKYGGTGLGLSISKNLCKIMGGSLQCESTPEIGSTFIATFNYKPNNIVKKNKSLELNEEQLAITKSLKVLVVEDWEDNRDIIKWHLEKLNVEFKIVENGLEAIYEAYNDDYDIIFMDIQMPTLNGKDATYILRWKGYRKPIIALTASVSSNEISQYLENGFNGAIGKPFNEANLYSLINQYRTGIIDPYKVISSTNKMKSKKEVICIANDAKNILKKGDSNAALNCLHKIKLSLLIYSSFSEAKTILEAFNRGDVSEILRIIYSRF